MGEREIRDGCLICNTRTSGQAIPRNELATLIGQALRECGLTVSREEAAGRCLEIEGIPAAPVSSLLIADAVTVRWEYCPSDTDENDPKRTADIVTALLSDDDTPYERLGDGYSSKAMSLKGIAGRELEARGFSVKLEVYQDHLSFDAWADISVSSKKESGMRVLVDDSGCIIWDADYLTGAEAVANDVKARMRRVTAV
jgi:hypothetical protein